MHKNTLCQKIKCNIFNIHDKTEAPTVPDCTPFSQHTDIINAHKNSAVIGLNTHRPMAAGNINSAMKLVWIVTFIQDLKVIQTSQFQKVYQNNTKQ
jgi:hypothetical protein